MRKLAISVIAACIMLSACGPNEQKKAVINDSFDMSTLPQGKVLSKHGGCYLTIMTNDSKIVEVSVPRFVYNTINEGTEILAVPKNKPAETTPVTEDEQ